MRILVVDDSAFMRKTIARILASDPMVVAVEAARNGEQALEKLRTFRPDLVTLDIEMPGMNGLDVLKRIRLESVEPRPAVLMCSTLTSAGSHDALRALRLGASDVVAKDSNLLAGDPNSMRSELLAKARAILEQRARNLSRREGVSSSVLPSACLKLPSECPELLLIGSSTGGPPILEKLLLALPAGIQMPVVVAQHMPALFTKSIAERLDQVCAVSVVHGDQERQLHAGTVHISQGGRHGRVIRRGGTLWFSPSDQPSEALYKPSVTELFLSAARCGLRSCVAVVLTGMGDDGAVGARALKSSDGIVIAQDAASCVVYGMPRAVVDAGIADASMTPDELAEYLGTISTRSRAVA